jgi:hypothetical protein
MVAACAPMPSPAPAPAPAPAASPTAVTASSGGGELEAPAEAAEPDEPSAAPSPLTCRRPWDCQADTDLVGLSVASLKERYGDPHWQGAQEMAYRFPLACGDPPQHLVLTVANRRVTAARFAWSLGSDCLEEAMSLVGEARPIDLDCGPFAASCPAVRRLVGLDELRVAQGLGLPHHAEAGLWSYHRPRHCSYERTIIELRVDGGRVKAAAWKHEVTGEHCEPVE